jgi:hypothetical protein
MTVYVLMCWCVDVLMCWSLCWCVDDCFDVFMTLIQCTLMCWNGFPNCWRVAALGLWWSGVDNVLMCCYVVNWSGSVNTAYVAWLCWSLWCKCCLDDCTEDPVLTCLRWHIYPNWASEVVHNNLRCRELASKSCDILNLIRITVDIVGQIVLF